jgi:ferritin-like metal-binding protein YciE
VGLFTKSIKTMDDLFLHVLQDVYYAEKQIARALPGLIEKTTSRQLAAALKSLLDAGETAASRLEQAFDLVSEKPKGTSCPAIDGILKEARGIAGDIGDKQVLDAALLAALQAVDHYRIARYGTLVAWARELRRTAVGRLLSANLAANKAADRDLSAVAGRKADRKAAAR